MNPNAVKYLSDACLIHTCILVLHAAGVQYAMHYGGRLRRFYQATICRRYSAKSDIIVKQTCSKQVTSHICNIIRNTVFITNCNVCYFNFILALWP